MTNFHAPFYPRCLLKNRRGGTRSEPIAFVVEDLLLDEQRIARLIATTFISRRIKVIKASAILRSVRKNHGSTVHALQVQLQNLTAEVEELRSQLPDLQEAIHDPLAAAKARGTSYAKTEWQKSENFTLVDAAHYSHRSDRMINVARNKGELYALVLDGNTRGFRYPQWQFDADPARLAQVLQVLHTASLSCWPKHQFLMRPNLLLNGRSPRELILDRDADLGLLVQIARDRYASDQGAS